MKSAIALDDLLMLLVRHERGLHDLYFTYAELFPDQRDFWLELAVEETLHAKMLEGLLIHAAGLLASSDALRLRPAAVQHAIDYVAKEIAVAKGKGLTYGEALSNAVFLEHSIVESKFYETFPGAPTEIADAFTRMRQLIRGHVKRVETEWTRMQTLLTPRPS